MAAVSVRKSSAAVWFDGCSAGCMACRYCGVGPERENHGTMAECVEALRAETERLSAKVAEKQRTSVGTEPVNGAQSATAAGQPPMREQIRSC